MISITDLSFSYPEKQILRSLNESVQDGEILGIMGTSGCGKTTFLNLLAGLLSPTEGKITGVPKNLSYVFQQPRLFPWLTVKGNLDALFDSPLPREKCEEVLSSLGLHGVLDLAPEELSVGMQMRVSLARAILYDGDLFLLDEPFASLDAPTRKEITAFLKPYFKEKGKTAILVTHSGEDAKRLADRIIFL